MALFTTDNRTALADINITPLCDVLLVLLIIFMVTAPLLTQGIDVNLPQAQAKEVSQTQDDVILTVRYSKTGNDYQIFLGGDPSPIGMEYLEKQLRTTFVDREKKDIFLRADQDVRYGDIAKIMAIAKLAGIERIGMMTRPEGS